jgi:hypothetical protein
VAKERDPSRWRAIPESDFAVTWQTPSRQILFRDRASAKKHPRFRKDATEPENQIRLSPLASFADARRDPASVRLWIRMEKSSRGRNYLPFRRWRAEHFGGAKNRRGRNRLLNEL